MPAKSLRLQTVAIEMIARHADLRHILETLRQGIGAGPEDRQIAVFLPDRSHWELAAAADLTPESEAVLAGIHPDSVSRSLLFSSEPWIVTEGASPGKFRARHLYSGIGEMLGLLVCLSARPGRPALDDLCRLAALAIEQRNLVAELTWQAEHDGVTGLSTRTRFERALSRRLGGVQRRTASDDPPPVALLCINLDRFRLVNGVLGHSLGNRVLKCVGMRFQSCLPPDSMLARVGGDEFAVLTTGPQAVELAERLLRSLDEPFNADEHQLFIGASVGIACAQASATAESLQREAWIALYHAKGAGKGRWVEFHPSMAAVPPERLEMEKCLRSALAKNEMALFYQAQVELTTGLVRGAEALLRWNPEGLGRISPSAFIPILEETGLIVEVGLWVLREACRQGIAWRRYAGRALRLSVNVSALQFLNPDFARDVERILDETGFPPDLLELELTESIFIQDFKGARAVLRRLRKIGVQCAIDDFGTGQSSLFYIHELPFQRLKIDRAFISPLTEGDKAPPIVGNIIGMAESLGMKTIAEGIDNVGQLDLLRSMGCDQGQGFFFSVPLPADEFLTLWHDLIEPVPAAGDCTPGLPAASHEQACVPQPT
jgi:diguanylate cyclase (GGDEF)-like protein